MFFSPLLPRSPSPTLIAVLLLLAAILNASAAELVTIAARDTLQPHEDASADATAALVDLTWKPAAFEVTLADVAESDHQAVIRFPSAISTRDEINDRVALLWHKPPDDDSPTPRPAIVVVHESGSAMPVGKLFAKAFAAKGFHSFLIHLPNYGLRRRDGVKPDGERFLLAMRQAIADVRRTRDAVAVLPGVDPQRIGLQGTSLGAFVASTTAGMDHGYQAVFLMLSGGDLYRMLQTGEKEAAELRRRLERSGYSGEKLRDLLHVVEPTRLAHRVDPEHTWLYTAEQDLVVPLENALIYKRAAKLDDAHHVRLWGDHTSTILYFPVIVDHVAASMSLLKEEDGTTAKDSKDAKEVQE
jgi:dienelactone hydrolase